MLHLYPVIDSGTTHSWDLSRRGTTRAKDAQGTLTQSHISPSILVYEDNTFDAKSREVDFPLLGSAPFLYAPHIHLWEIGAEGQVEGCWV
jgi:hypothetical protein